MKQQTYLSSSSSFSNLLMVSEHSELERQQNEMFTEGTVSGKWSFPDRVLTLTKPLNIHCQETELHTYSSEDSSTKQLQFDAFFTLLQLILQIFAVNV